MLAEVYAPEAARKRNMFHPETRARPTDPRVGKVTGTSRYMIARHNAVPASAPAAFNASIRDPCAGSVTNTKSARAKSARGPTEAAAARANDSRPWKYQNGAKP